MARTWKIPDPLAVGSQWPPTAITTRNQNYERRRLIYEGKHDEAFRATLKLPREVRIVPYPVGKIIARVLSSWLWRDGFRVEFPPEADEDTKANVNRMIEQTGLLKVARKVKRLASYRGDAYFRCTVDEEDPKSTDFGVLVNSPHSSMIYPHFATDNPEKATALSVYWCGEVTLPNGNKEKHLTLETFVPGLMQRRVYRTGNTGQIEAVLEDETFDTKVPVSLVLHVANGEPEGWYGESDVEEIAPMVMEAVDILTRTKRAINIGTYPRVIVPRSSITIDDESGKAIIDLAEGEALVENGADNPFRYLSWNGDLQPAYELLKVLKEIIYLLSGVSETSLGFGVTDGATESGRAIALRMALTLFKTEEEKPTYERALENIILAAQHLEVLQGAKYQPTAVRVTIPKTLPESPSEIIAYIKEAKAQGLMSNEAAFLELNPKVDPSKVKEELAKIAGEKPAAPSSFRERALSRLGSAQGSTVAG